MKKNTKKYLIYFFGALGGLLYGYDTGVISGALLFINNDIPLNTLTEDCRQHAAARCDFRVRIKRDML